MTTKTNEDTRIQEARESFSGRLLTDAQFEEAIAITRIIEREIGKSGTFKDKLGDYSYAMSRTERMDAVKAETIIRDLFRSTANMPATRASLSSRPSPMT